jgi:type III secretion protein C
LQSSYLMSQDWGCIVSSKYFGNRLSHWVVLASILVVWLTGDVAHAADIRWRSGNYTYATTTPKPLKEFIQIFAASQGLTAVVSSEVEGTIVGRFNMAPMGVLDLLSTNYALIWYFDGNILYVYAANEAKSEIVRPTNSTVAALRQTLVRLDILDKRYPIAFDAKQNSALVSGPKRYVELVQQAAKGTETAASAALGADLRVFALKYAWASDYKYTQNGRELTIPGIVNVLRGLYGRGDTRGGLVSGLTRSASSERELSSAAKVRSLGLSSASANTTDIVETGEVTSFTASGDLPQFMADGRRNAIIIRDVPERMANYEQVIKALDQRPGLVEVEARIIEISSDAVESLGIDWNTSRWQTPLGNGGISVGLNPGAAATVSAGTQAVLVGELARQIVAKIHALAERGKANILSSPKIQTLDNIEATIENLSTFFVRVSGNLDTNLFKVSSGTSMRVHPLIVDEGDHREIRLAVRIEDGGISTQQVDQIPVTQTTTINTHALIREGDALLIAGYAAESRREGKSGIPVISDVPWFGNLFSKNDEKVSKMERIFLLTPKVVSSEVKQK